MTNGFQKNFEISLNDELVKERQKVERLIQDVSNNVNNGIIAAGANFEKVVRNVRAQVLANYLSIKAKLQGEILDDFFNGVRVDRIEELKNIKSEIYKSESNIKIITNEIEQLEGENDYDEYIKYTLHSKEPFVKNAYQQFKNTGIKRQAFGVFITLLCAATDFFMLYTVFIMGNLSQQESMLSAFIFALVLDVPPYILGWIITSKNDKNRLHNIIKDRQSNMGYNIAIGLILTTLFITLVLYIFVRVILFLGNGDFSEALRSVFSGTFEIGNREFSASDLLSSIVPIATSVVSFVIGIVLFSSFVDFLKSISIETDKFVRDRILEKTEVIEKITNDMNTAKEKLKESKQEIWKQYNGISKKIETDEYEFFGKLANEVSKLQLPRYVMTYKNCSRLILNEASDCLVKVKEGLAPRALSPLPIKEMIVNDIEQNQLNRIWVEWTEVHKSAELLEDEIQHVETTNAIKEMEERIEELKQLLIS